MSNSTSYVLCFLFVLIVLEDSGVVETCRQKLQHYQRETV